MQRRVLEGGFIETVYEGDLFGAPDGSVIQVWGTQISADFGVLDLGVVRDSLPHDLESDLYWSE